MTNPVFNNSAVFGDPRARGSRGGRAPQPTAQPGAYGATATGPVIEAQSLEQMYGAPAATTRDTGRLTYDDVIIKTGGLLALLVVVAAATWNVAPGLWPIGALVGLVLGLVNAFKKNPSPLLITLYTVAQGVFLGGISLAFQNMTFDGQGVQPIVLQAVIATFATFGAALFLFKSGRVRVTPKFTRWLLIAMVGYLAYSLVNVVMMFFVSSDGFGPLRNGPIGVIAGLFAVGLAAASLIMDFDAIKRGVEQGVPAKFAWSAAFGLIVTLVWLYLEILRILAILQGRD
ncbi:Bax inhibitor-1/YccA family protein [Cellulomonas sp. IC4_254]|uniref:Bax inhibitor-1/YccA family protein n=1 Tax=Cellulomonas sp. IC4_254 TaxID=2714040 RepID=UPI001421E39E|nr:Bax inhibitor-1/YccA family protein [Cellulomonas sp. IC4_254]NHT16681.1 Bax inhibitor-1/YccA family protein [Cellulomonas sp. IC4_254]